MVPSSSVSISSCAGFLSSFSSTSAGTSNSTLASSSVLGTGGEGEKTFGSFSFTFSETDLTSSSRLSCAFVRLRGTGTGLEVGTGRVWELGSVGVGGSSMGFVLEREALGFADGCCGGGLGSVGVGGSSMGFVLEREALGFADGCCGGGLGSVGVGSSMALVEVRGFAGGWGLGFLGGVGFEILGGSTAFTTPSSLECLLAGTGLGGGEGLVGMREIVESCSFGGFFGGSGLGDFLVFEVTLASVSVIVPNCSASFSASLSSISFEPLADLSFGLRGTEGLCPLLAAVAGEGAGEEEGDSGCWLGLRSPGGVLGGVSC